MKRTIVGLILALVLAVGMGLPVMAGTPPAPSLTPSTVTATIAPGGSTQITKIVQTPTIAPNLDVVFLCDTTGSMGGVISAMQTNASTIMTSILAGSSTAEFAVGEYKDKTNYPADPFDFKLDQMMTANTSLVTAGINSWATILGSGGDIPEEQLYALDQIAATSIGFRTGSTRIIVWMGDDPGHDQSIDPPAAGGMTLTTCIAALTGGANAPIKVIAIPVNDSDEGLDFTGQATAITSATGGQLMPACNSRPGRCCYLKRAY